MEADQAPPGRRADGGVEGGGAEVFRFAASHGRPPETPRGLAGREEVACGYSRLLSGHRVPHRLRGRRPDAAEDGARADAEEPGDGGADGGLAPLEPERAADRPAGVEGRGGLRVREDIVDGTVAAAGG